MKNERLMLNLMWAFIGLSFIVTWVAFNSLPALIPMHWNIHGEIDSWYPKFPWAFLLPVMGVVIAALVTVLPKIDPRRENYEKFRIQFIYIRLSLVIFFVIMQMVILASSLGANFLRVDTVVKFMVGILFVVLGNVMPKIKNNFFVGIKTPWTLTNNTVWAKTHRHGGFVWFIIGMLMSVLAFIPGTRSAAAYFILVAIAAIEPIVYSWLQYKREAQ